MLGKREPCKTKTAWEVFLVSLNPAFVNVTNGQVDNAMTADDVMQNIRQLFEQSGMTLNELGEGLGYNGPTAKKRAWFLLYRTSNPRISTVLAVAQALGVKISDLVK